MTAAKLAYQTRFSIPSQLDSPVASYGHFVTSSYQKQQEQRLLLQAESTKLNAPVSKVLSNFDQKAHQLRRFYESTSHQLRSLKNNFPDLQPLGVLSCPILNAIKNRFPVGITILGQTYRAKCHVVNRLFHDMVISQEAMFDLTEGRMIHFRHGANNHAEISGHGSYVVLDIILPSGSESDYDSDGSRGGIPSKDLRFKQRVEAMEEKEPVEESIIKVTLNNQLLKDGASVVVSPSSPVFDCQEFLDYMTSTCLPFIIYAIDHDQLTDQDLKDLVQLQERLPNSAVLFVRAQDDNVIHELNSSEKLYSQLESIGYLHPKGTRSTSWVSRSSRCQLLNSTANFHQHLMPLLRRQARAYLIEASTQLLCMIESSMSKLLGNCLDMSRDLTMTPRRISFAIEQERALVDCFRQVTEENTEQIILDALEATREELSAKNWELTELEASAANNNSLDSFVAEIDRVALGLVAKHVNGKISASSLKASDPGPLLRCLQQLEQNVEMATNEKPSTFLEELLKVGENHTFKPIDALPTQAAIKRKFKLLLTRTSQISDVWIQQHINTFLDLICPKKLGQSLHRSLRLRTMNVHDVFTSAIILLEQRQQTRLDRVDKTKSKLRKHVCPRLGKLILEASSFRDAIMYGMPRVGKEIGRGQYGVVAEAENWGQRARVAVKSIVPERECHWGDLAFEFYYTKWWLEPHPHIVKLYGSVIDENYGPGNGLQPAVLLIMERLSRDLYTAIKQGISYLDRIQVTLDVVAGLRYLHSQGLIHRDIKLKNVLLDANNRAKISDLGFCKPGALLSGSVVGTPIHMPPEIFAGSCDTAVDIYALGIMLWYICSGRTRLPKNFESCTSKEDLWTKVRRGSRPEYLPCFDPRMWTLMQNCWRGNPEERPMLGEVDDELKTVMKSELRKNQQHQADPLIRQASNNTTTTNPARQG